MYVLLRFLLNTNKGMFGPALSSACSNELHILSFSWFLHSTENGNNLRAAGDNRTSSPESPIVVERTSSGSNSLNVSKIKSRTSFCNLLPLFLAERVFIH